MEGPRNGLPIARRGERADMPALIVDFMGQNMHKTPTTIRPLAHDHAGMLHAAIRITKHAANNANFWPCRIIERNGDAARILNDHIIVEKQQQLMLSGTHAHIHHG